VRVKTEQMILEQLMSGPASIEELQAITGKSPATVYRHLALLRKDGHRIYRIGNVHEIRFELVR